MKHFFFLFFLAIFISFFPVWKLIPTPYSPEVKALYTQEPLLPVVSDSATRPDLSATSYVVTDLDSGVILLSKNPHQQLKPASLTKIMTALVAMDYYPEDAILKVVNGQRALGNTIDLIQGDHLIARDLFYGLLVPSGNDAALTLAENYPGGYHAFVAKMNMRVAELGLTNTHFVDVSGVEEANHYTSAFDISQIARTALERPVFKTVVSTQKMTLNSLDGHNYPLVSTNILLDKPGFYGVKTGWTPEAGECLVVLYEKDGHRLLISLLHSNDRFGEGEKLAYWTFANTSWQ